MVGNREYRKGDPMGMFAPAARLRKPDRDRRPAVEPLEGRVLLYSAPGNRFQEAAAITLSTVPDGTNLGGVTSNLAATLDARFGAGNWQSAILDAAAWWESQANLNIVVATDNGDPVGSGPYQQGNPNFADIRIGGFAMPANILATTLAPPPANGDSSSGDLFLNTAQPWAMNGSNYDLETVMIHELGHALGLGHSTLTTADMYANYTGVKRAPTADDVAGIQALYGARPNDAITLATGNNVFGTAANVSSATTQFNQVNLNGLNLLYTGDSDWYRVYTPANASSTFTVVVQSSGLSLLAPKVQVWDANGNGLAQGAVSGTTYGAFAGTSIYNATPNTWYYVRVQGASSGPNGVGAYALFLNMGPYALVGVGSPITPVANKPSQGGGSYNQVAGADGQGGAADIPFDYTHLGTIRAVGDDLTIAPALLHGNSKHARLRAAHPTARAWARQVSGRRAWAAADA